MELKRFVREKAGGNPFYLEEIMNSLVESNTLVPEKDQWVLRKTIGDSQISSTIHGVIAARIDRIEAEMKNPRLLKPVKRCSNSAASAAITAQGAWDIAASAGAIW